MEESKKYTPKFLSLSTVIRKKQFFLYDDALSDNKKEYLYSIRHCISQTKICPLCDFIKTWNYTNHMNIFSFFV